MSRTSLFMTLALVAWLPACNLLDSLEPESLNSGDAGISLDSGSGNVDLADMESSAKPSDQGSDAANPETADASGDFQNREDSSPPFVPKLVSKTQNEAGVPNYWEYLPKSYSQATTLSPLLLVLHDNGFGGGTEEELQALRGFEPIERIGQKRWPEELPFVVIAPQFPKAQTCEDQEALRLLMIHLFDTYELDPERIYIVGEGCGGIKALEYMRRPQGRRTAAAVTTVGVGLLPYWKQFGCGLRNSAFHGFVDKTNLGTDFQEEVYVAGALAQGCNEVREQTGVVSLYDDNSGLQRAFGAGHLSWMEMQRKKIPDTRRSLISKDRVLVDFGKEGETTPEPWNNIVYARYGVSDEVLNQKGQRTTASVRIWERFRGELVRGPFSVEEIPGTASRDFIFVGGEVSFEDAAKDAGQVVITGLDPSLTYTLTLFTGYNNGDQNVSLLSMYTVQGQSETIDPRNNVDKFVRFSSVKPTQEGVITIDIRMSIEGVDGSLFGGGYATLNTLEILVD